MSHRVLAAVTLAALVAGRSGAEPPAPSLELVPTDAAAFLHVRVADLYDSPFGKSFRAALAKADPQAMAEVETRLGIPVANVATVTYIVPKFDAPGPGTAILVTTRAPVPKDALLKAGLLPGPGLRRRSDGVSVAVLNDRAIVSTSDLPPADAAALFKRMALPAGNGPGPLRAAVDRAAGKAAAAGLNVKALPPLPPGFKPPPPFDALLPLAKAEVISAGLDVSGPQTTLTIRADLPAAGDAAEGEKAARAGLKLLGDMLGQFAAAPAPPGPEGNLIRQLLNDARAAVGKAEVGRDRASVTATLTTPALATHGAEIATAAASAVRSAHQAAEQARDANNLKQIALAMYKYNDANGRLPAHAISAKDGKTPLLSWRVAILPYLDQHDLYKQFKLDEPWDSPANKPLIARMPTVYLSPKAPPGKEPGRTHYQVFVGGGAAWDRGDQHPAIPRTFVDGTSNTILLAEAAEAVVWTKPDDLPFDPNKPLPKLGLSPDRPFLVAMADGSVRAVKRTVTDKTLRAAITTAGGEILDRDWNDR